MRRSISTFVTRKKEQHFTASKVRMKKTETIFKASSECVSAYNLNANATHVYTRFFCFFCFFFDWGMGGVMLCWVEVKSQQKCVSCPDIGRTTEVPEQRRVATSLSDLCLLSVMPVPAGQLM